MSKNTFQNYLNSYKEALLDLIPNFYDGSIPLSDTLPIRFQEKDKYFQKELQQAKKWDKKKSVFLKKLNGVIGGLDSITSTNKSKPPKFRYKFYLPVYDEKDNPLLEGSIEEISKNIIAFFIIDLAKLRSAGVKEKTAEQQILKEMHEQESDYLQEYGNKLAYPLKQGKQPEGGIGQTNAKRNLSNGEEYIRLDDDNKFYAKAKGKTSERGLELAGQSHHILHCLWYEWDLKIKKAAVAIDKVLHEAVIKDHKKGENIAKDKRDHLSIKITPIRRNLVYQVSVEIA